jgi:hypothetical protein
VPYAIETKKLTFYEQISGNVVQIKEHRSVCVEGLEWAKEEDKVVGSGFFVKRISGNDVELFLVTARHVVDKQYDLFISSLHPKDANKKIYLKLPRNLWIFHPGPNPRGKFPIDVAAMKVKAFASVIAFVYCPNDCPKSSDKNKPRNNQLGETAEVGKRAIFFGFPVILVPVGSLEPFARTGVIAFKGFNPKLPISGLVPADKKLFYVDAVSFSGNSGGPVMQEPLPLQGQINLWGLITGGTPSILDFAIVTSVERIKQTIEHANEIRIPVNNRWTIESPSLPIRCEPDQRKPSQ